MQEESDPDTFLALLLGDHLLLLEGAHSSGHTRSLLWLRCRTARLLDLERATFLLDIVQDLDSFILDTVRDALAHTQHLFDNRVVYSLLYSAELASDHLTLSSFARDDGSEEHRQEHQVVVLNPDHVASLDHSSDDVGKPHVGFSVGEPVGGVKVHLSRVVVEQWPEDRVGEAWVVRGVLQANEYGIMLLTIVVSVGEVIVEVDRVTLVFVQQSLVDMFTIRFRDLGSALDWCV
jgi:hypothetical protein